MGELSRGPLAAIVLACALLAPGCGAIHIARGAEPCAEDSCLRPRTECPYDSVDCNPPLDDVVSQVSRLRQHGQPLGFHREGMPAITRDHHWQSIQRMAGSASNVLLVTRSTAELTDPRIASVELGSRRTDGGLLGTNQDRTAGPPAIDQVIAAVTSSSAHTHAGGTQLLGKVLAVPLEDHTRGSKVELFDMQNPEHPVWLSTIDHTIDATSHDEAGTASMTMLDDGTVLLVIGRRHARTLDFYRSNTSDLGTTSWQHWDTWSAGELRTALFDSEYGDYQNLNLIVSSDGRLYLLGLHEDGFFRPEHWVDLFEVGRARDVTLTKVAKRQLWCAGQCNLDAGGGSYIDPHGELIVYGIEYGSSGPDQTVRLVEF